MALEDTDIDKLVNRMKEVFPTKDEHSALDKTVNEIADVVNLHTEKLNSIPSRTDFEQMLEKSLSYAVLKVEHDRMKKVIQEKLGVEI